MNKIVCAAVVALGVLASFGKTVYVNCQLADYSGHDGTTPEKAMETIQDGLKKATEDGDLVLVAPGDYDKGLGRVMKNASGGHWWGNCRLLIAHTRKLTVRSTGGAAVTHIVGKYDPETVDGIGTNAVRCLAVERAANSPNPVVFEGFTFRDGSTSDSSSCPGWGGAAMATTGNNDADRNIFFVDCVFTNCQGAASVVRGGTFVRCRFQDNQFRKGSTVSSCGFCNTSSFLNCLFTRNMAVDAEGKRVTTTVFFQNVSTSDSTKFVNCTFADNLAYWYSNSGVRMYNCLHSLSRFVTDDGSQSYRYNVCVDSTAVRALMAPSLGDFRVRKGGAADQGGKSEYLTDETLIPLPEGVERLLDVDRNPIDVSAGTVAVGAVQTVAEQKAGALVGADANVNFDGSKRACFSAPYVCPAAYPTNYLASVQVADSQKRVLYYNFSGARPQMPGIEMERDWAAPNDWREDRHWVMPPPDVALVQTVNAATVYVKYVDAESTETAASQDGSQEHPFSTIQAAIDSSNPDSSSSKVVLLRPGVYDKGYGLREWSAEGLSLKARATFGAKHIRIVGLEGPEKTFIVGAPDPDNLPANGGDGCGKGATMCIAMNSNGSVQGCTLTGGYSGTGPATGSGRGPIFSYGTDLQVTDCIVTNNVGRNHAVGTARFERCYIADNKGASGVFFGAKLIACVIGNNTITDTTGKLFDSQDNDAFRCYLYSCSFAGDGVHDTFASLSTHSRYVNSVGFGCAGKAPAGTPTAGCVASGFSTIEPGVGCVNDDPLFIDMSLATPDYRVFTRSAARTAAISPADEMAEAWWYFCACDFNGNPWTFDAAGRPIAGALQDVVSGGVYVARGAGGVAVVSGGSFGLNALAAGETVTVGFVPGSKRPVNGLVVNGVTNFFAESSSAAPTLAYAAEAGVDAAIVPAYGSTWFVDAVNGDDADTGYTGAGAFKTLQKAMEQSGLLKGDTVVALPGVYDQGKMLQDATHTLPARAVVKAGVTLASRDGADVTFIKGEASDVTDEPPTQDANYVDYCGGLGANAVRCVYLLEDAVVRGMTLTNGYTRILPAATTDMSKRHYDADTTGGGASGSSLGRLERCVITGCKAFRGGGTYACRAVECLFDGNVALYGGGASSDARHFGCVTRNNFCSRNVYWGGIFFWAELENTTTLDSLGGPNAAGCVMKNTLAVGSVGSWESIVPDMGSGHNFSNCLFVASATGYVNTYRAAIEAGVNSHVLDASELQVDADGRPVVGANRAVDAADGAIAAYLSDTDLFGGQRVYNGAMDIGALEGDWRATYAKGLAGARATVETATPNVVESAAKTVILNPEAKLEATLAGSKGGLATDYGVKAKVTGNGRLIVKLNGESLGEPLQGPCDLTEIKFTNALAENSLSFEYLPGVDDTGSAELVKMNRYVGTLLFIR